MNYCGHGVFQPWNRVNHCPRCEVYNALYSFRFDSPDEQKAASYFAVLVHFLRLLIKQHEDVMEFKAWVERSHTEIADAELERRLRGET